MWCPNALIDVDLSQARWQPTKLIITSVTYVKSLGGTKAILSLTVPEALMPEPLAIANEAAILKRSADTAPKSNAPPQTVANTETTST